MKILVTGNAGFIGFHTAKRLLERGDSVVGFDVVNDYYDPAIKEARLTILVFNHGRHTCDFTYVDDIVEGVIRASDDVAAPNPD